MAGLASIDELQTLMKKTFEGEGLAQAQLVLNIVSSWVQVIASKAWPDPDDVPFDVKGVVLAASRRDLLAPPDRAVARTMGPLQVQFAPPPDGFFTDAELAILRRFRPQARNGGLRTISTTRGEYGRPWAGKVRLGKNGQPWTIFEYGDLGWWDESDCWDGDPFE